MGGYCGRLFRFGSSQVLGKFGKQSTSTRISENFAASVKTVPSWARCCAPIRCSTEISNLFADTPSNDPITEMDGRAPGRVSSGKSGEESSTPCGSGGICSIKWRGGAIKPSCLPALTPSNSRTSGTDNEAQALCTLSSESALHTLLALSTVGHAKERRNVTGSSANLRQFLLPPSIQFGVSLGLSHQPAAWVLRSKQKAPHLGGTRDDGD
jgi:hypothetical protein